MSIRNETREYGVYVDLYQDMDSSSSSVSRCNLRPTLLQSGCKEEFIESPVSRTEVKENRILTDRAQGSTGDITQIQPQRIHLTLRPGMIQIEHMASDSQHIFCYSNVTSLVHNKADTTLSVVVF